MNSPKRATLIKPNSLAFKVMLFMIFSYKRKIQVTFYNYLKGVGLQPVVLFSRCTPKSVLFKVLRMD
jgi:hypothetical protein